MDSRNCSILLIVFLYSLAACGKTTAPETASHGLTPSPAIPIIISGGEASPTDGLPESPSWTPTQTSTNVNPPASTETFEEVFVIAGFGNPLDVITSRNINNLSIIGSMTFKSTILDIQWSPDGKLIALLTEDAVILCDGVTFNMLAIQDVTAGLDTIIRFSPDSRQLGTNIRLGIPKEGISLPGGVLLKSYPHTFAFSPTGDYVASVQGANGIEIIPTGDGITGYSLSSSDKPTQLAISEDGQSIAIYFEWTDDVKILNPYTKAMSRAMKLNNSRYKLNISPEFYSPTNSLFVLLGSSNTADLLAEWDYQNIRPIDVQQLPTFTTSFSISEAGGVIALNSAKKRYVLPIHGCSAYDLISVDLENSISGNSFSPDGRYLWGRISGRSLGFWGIVHDDTSTDLLTPTSTPNRKCPTGNFSQG